MPRVLPNRLVGDAAAVATNVLTNDDLLTHILEQRGLHASRHALVCKQWKRAAAAAKLSGQTLEPEPHVSCGGGFNPDDEGEEGEEAFDEGAFMAQFAGGISALPDNNLLVVDTNACRILKLTPLGERLVEYPVPAAYPVTAAALGDVMYYSCPMGGANEFACGRFRISDGEELPPLPVPEQYLDIARRGMCDFVVAPDLNRLFMLRFLQPETSGYAGHPGSIDVYDLDTLTMSFSFGAFPPDTTSLAYGSSQPSLFVGSKSGRISVYSPDGSFLRAFGSPGRKPGSFLKLTGIAVSTNRLFTAEERGVDFVGRVQVLTLDGLPLQVLPINTCGSPTAICVSGQYVHVVCGVADSREALLCERLWLWQEKEQWDLGHPMHSLVGFKIRAGKS